MPRTIELGSMHIRPVWYADSAPCCSTACPWFGCVGPDGQDGCRHTDNGDPQSDVCNPAVVALIREHFFFASHIKLFIPAAINEILEGKSNGTPEHS